MALELRLLLLVLLVVLPSLRSSPTLHLATQKQPDMAPGMFGDIWKNCSGARDPLKIVSVSIIPDPPKKGERVSFHAEVELEETVTSGMAGAVLKYGIIPFYAKTWQLCDLVHVVHSHCPVKKGTVMINFNTTVPGDLPSGHYTGHAMALDQNNTELLCINFDFHL